MQLSHLHIIGQSGLKAIQIEGEKIAAITDVKEASPTNPDKLYLTFENAIAFPGLINSHDHLDFNLFPQLKTRVYNNYTEWGTDIHQTYKDTIEKNLKIPLHIRQRWGIYKNILNGVTTVVDHGTNFQDDTLITIHNKIVSYHSISGEKFWKLKLNLSFSKNDQPVVIHIGEGTDDFSFKEIDKIIKWNFFKRDLIGVHGVSMNDRQAKAFEALIWCPASNFFLLNKTAKIDELKKQTKILFGTDSTLSASWNLWEQLRQARETKQLNDEELFDSLTSSAAFVWKLADKGILSEGKDADIVIARRKDLHDWNSFYQIDPVDILLVVSKGSIILFDDTFYPYLREISNNFNLVSVNESGKYVKGNLPDLIRQIQQYAPGLNLPISI